MHEQDELAVGGGEEESLAAALRAAEPASLEHLQRRIERLQRGNVRRPGLRDREGRHRVIELAPPRLHFRQFRH